MSDVLTHNDHKKNLRILSNLVEWAEKADVRIMELEKELELRKVSITTVEASDDEVKDNLKKIKKNFKTKKLEDVKTPYAMDGAAATANDIDDESI